MSGFAEHEAPYWDPQQRKTTLIPCPRDIHQPDKAGRVRTLLVFQQDLQSVWKGTSAPAGQAYCPPSPAQPRASTWIQTPAGNGLVSSDLLDRGSTVLHREIPFSNRRDRASRLRAAAVGDSSRPAADDWGNFSSEKKDKGDTKPHAPGRRIQNLPPATAAKSRQTITGASTVRRRFVLKKMSLTSELSVVNCVQSVLFKQ